MRQLEEMDFLPDPDPQVARLVVQHNALAEARYRLSLRAQKLLIRLIAELDQRSDDFSEVRLSLADFAVLAAQERNDVTFAHFCDAAEQFLGRFVAITQPPIAGEEQSRQLLCHWISSIEKNPNDKSITFSFDKKLRPYLLGLKKNFYFYHTLYAFNLGSAYGIRLYQWAKSREYLKRPQQVTVDELRLSLGTIEFDGRGKVVKESLKRYADFNRVAVRPAMKEINEKTDICLAFREVKRPGTKIVASLVFSVRQKEATPKLKTHEIPVASQFDLFRGSAVATELSEPQELLDYVAATFQLNDDQERKVDGYIQRNGIEYLREKLTLTELEPRENAARYFMAALRDDFKLPVRHGDHPKKSSKRPAPSTVEEVPKTEEELRAATEQAREMKLAVATNLGFAVREANL
jgi:plasmid replication initiation protein